MMEEHIISFGNYSWNVIDVRDDRLLIITENILDLRWYNSEFVDVTWENCDLRSFLNNEFYHAFSRDERKEIIAVTNSNPDNPWFKTEGGADTFDRIFLLSLLEVCRYFGNSEERLANKGSQKWYIDDGNNERRQAKFGDKYHWWRLRSPGYYGRTAASVNGQGFVYVRGNGVYGKPKDGGGLRPALWLKRRGRFRK